jgi:uncharacterized protein DUF5681
MTKPRGYDAVGKGRPPKATQFKKGQSGNPGGRPKGAKGVNTIVREVLNSKVTILEGGRRRKISKLEFIVTRLANDAAQGKPSAVKYMLELLKAYPMTDSAQESATRVTLDMTPQEASEAYARMLKEIG